MFSPHNYLWGFFFPVKKKWGLELWECETRYDCRYNIAVKNNVV